MLWIFFNGKADTAYCRCGWIVTDADADTAVQQQLFYEHLVQLDDGSEQ